MFWKPKDEDSFVGRVVNKDVRQECLGEMFGRNVWEGLAGLAGLAM